MQLLKNVTAAFTANAVTAGAQYVLVVLVARLLGPEAFGTFVFALTFGSLVAVVPNFGLDRVLLRQVVREPSRQGAWFASAAVIRLGLAIVAIGVAATVPWFAPPGTGLAVFLIVLSLVFALGAELCRSLLYAAGAMPFEAAFRAGGRVLTLAAAAGAVLIGGTLDHLAAALAAAALIEAALYFAATARRVGLAWEAPSRAMVGALAASALPIALNTLFVLLYFRASVLMVTAWAGVQAAGQFGAAFTFLQVLQVASGSLATVVLPHFVQHGAGGPDALGGRVDVVTRLLLLGIVPVAATLSLLAPEIVGLVYSTSYAAAAPALVVLAWASIFMFAGSLHGTLLIALDAERTLLWLSPIAAVVSLTANALLIDRLGIVGASWATLLTEALVGVVCIGAVRRRLGTPRLSTLAWPIALGTAIAGAMVVAGPLPLQARAVLAALSAVVAGLGLRPVAGPMWHSVRQAIAARGSAGA